ncbi:hypothetical protein C8J56DRAFT_896157 [Mycena floridula]|nr:hypothetical protein C8J56DRAFT_896157 [Mycena floridula]
MATFTLPSDINNLHPDPSVRDALIQLFTAVAAAPITERWFFSCLGLLLADITGDREDTLDDLGVCAAMYRAELQQFDLYRSGFVQVRPRNWKLLALTERSVKRRLEITRAKERAARLVPPEVKPWTGLTVESIDRSHLFVNYPENQPSSNVKGHSFVVNANIKAACLEALYPNEINYVVCKGSAVGVFNNWEAVTPLLTVSGAVSSNEQSHAAAEDAFHLARDQDLIQSPISLFAIGQCVAGAELMEEFGTDSSGIVGRTRGTEISLAAGDLESGESGVDEDARVALAKFQPTEEGIIKMELTLELFCFCGVQPRSPADCPIVSQWKEDFELKDGLLLAIFLGFEGISLLLLFERGDNLETRHVAPGVVVQAKDSGSQLHSNEGHRLPAKWFRVTFSTNAVATSGILQPGSESSLPGPARISLVSQRFQRLLIITTSSFCLSLFLEGSDYLRHIAGQVWIPVARSSGIPLSVRRSRTFIAVWNNAGPPLSCLKLPLIDPIEDTTANTHRPRASSEEEKAPAIQQILPSFLADIEKSRSVRRYIQHLLGFPDPPMLDWIRSQRFRWDLGYLAAPDADIHRGMWTFAAIFLFMRRLWLVQNVWQISVTMEKPYIAETRQVMQAQTNARMAHCTLFAMAMAISHARHQHHIEGRVWTLPEELSL